MFIKDEVTLEKAMETVSESIATFKRFVEALNKFLELHEIGSAGLDQRPGYPTLDESDNLGYDVAMFHLRDPFGKDVIYLDLYTSGMATGENFLVKDNRSNLGGLKGCSWEEAIREILVTVGVLQHTALSREKIEKVIEMLG
jgi:hypothetical protein